MDNNNPLIWTPPNEITTAPIEVIKQIVTQAQDREKDLEAIQQNIANRAQNLIILLVGLMTATMGFIVTQDLTRLYIGIPGVVSILYCNWIVSILFDKVYTGRYAPIGSEPSSAIRPKIVAAHPKDMERFLLLNLMTTLEDRIKKNAQKNEDRWTYLEKAVHLSMLLPPLLILTYLFSLIADLILSP